MASESSRDPSAVTPSNPLSDANASVGSVEDNVIDTQTTSPAPMPLSVHARDSDHPNVSANNTLFSPGLEIIPVINDKPDLEGSATRPLQTAAHSIQGSQPQPYIDNPSDQSFNSLSSSHLSPAQETVQMLRPDNDLSTSRQAELQPQPQPSSEPTGQLQACQLGENSEQSQSTDKAQLSLAQEPQLLVRTLQMSQLTQPASVSPDVSSSNEIDSDGNSDMKQGSASELPLSSSEVPEVATILVPVKASARQSSSPLHSSPQTQSQEAVDMTHSESRKALEPITLGFSKHPESNSGGPVQLKPSTSPPRSSGAAEEPSASQNMANTKQEEQKNPDGTKRELSLSASESLQSIETADIAPSPMEIETGENKAQSGVSNVVNTSASTTLKKYGINMSNQTSINIVTLVLFLIYEH